RRSVTPPPVSRGRRAPPLVTSCAVSVWNLVVIEHPILRCDEVDSGEGPDDDEEQPCQSGGVPHIELVEALLVEVQRIERRRIGGPAVAPRDDECLRERLERTDELQHEIEEHDGAEQGKRDLAELHP